MFDVYWIKQTTEKIDKQNLSRIVKDFLRLSLYFLECIFLVQKKEFFVCFPVLECSNVSEYYDEVFDGNCKRYSYTLRREICR